MQPGPDGRREISLGQAMAHITFPKSYVELIAVRHPGQGNHLDTWLARREGLHLLGFHADDTAQSSQALVDAGLIVPPLRESSRRITTAGVEGTARFRWFELPDSITQEAFSYVVQELTPELTYDSRLLQHANGALGIRSVFAVVDNMD